MWPTIFRGVRGRNRGGWRRSARARALHRRSARAVVRREIARDPVLLKVVRYAENGRPKKMSDPESLPYFRRTLELSVENGCIMRGIVSRGRDSDTDDHSVTGARPSADVEQAQPGPHAGVLEQRIVPRISGQSTSGVGSSRSEGGGGTAEPISSTVPDVDRALADNGSRLCREQLF
ncbi:hypothetical protein EVAR_17871_1 [Eumeta japonica]|uniref:Uncharacterized protein n=1 Tax=Eumeta variegata TaxID=151549 RepID=A0A4C1ZNG8_EUMVA|nr:hypothetical protein EVAR_17871_1 [Eumeta japonica]